MAGFNIFNSFEMKCLERMPPGILKCWPSYHFFKGREGGWLVADMFPCPCYEKKMAQGRDVARSHCWDNASNWSDTSCSKGI